MDKNNRIFKYKVLLPVLMIFGLVVSVAEADVGIGAYFGGHNGGHYGGYHGYSYGYGHNGYGYGHSYGYYPHAYSYSHYSYPYYAYQGEYYSRSYYPRTYGNATYNSGYDKSNRDKDYGWYLLAKNKPYDAYKVFADQAENAPNEGVPKVGYALAAGLQGDLNKANWAMRRAFRIDPSSLHYINLEPSVQTKMKAMINDYDHRDDAFMVAALQYLLHNDQAAQEAIDRAIDDDRDNSESASNLYDLLAQSEQPRRKY